MPSKFGPAVEIDATPNGSKFGPAVMIEAQPAREGGGPAKVSGDALQQADQRSVLGRVGKGALGAIGGMASMVTHPVDSAVGEADRVASRAHWAQGDLEQGNYGRAALNAVKALPGIGGMVEHGMERISKGEIPELVGEGLVMRATPAVVRGVKEGAKSAASGMADFARKPGTGQMVVGGAEVAGGLGSIYHGVTSGNPTTGIAGGLAVREGIKQIKVGLAARRGIPAVVRALNPDEAPPVPLRPPLAEYVPTGETRTAVEVMRDKTNAGKGAARPSITPKEIEAQPASQAPSAETIKAYREANPITADPTKARLMGKRGTEAPIEPDPTIEEISTPVDIPVRRPKVPRPVRKPVKAEEVATPTDTVPVVSEEANTGAHYKGIQQDMKVKRYTAALKGKIEPSELESLAPVIDELSAKKYATIKQAENWLGRDHPAIPALKMLSRAVEGDGMGEARLPSKESFGRIVKALRDNDTPAPKQPASTELAFEARWRSRPAPSGASGFGFGQSTRKPTTGTVPPQVKRKAK